MTRQTIILFRHSSPGGDYVGTPRCEDSNSAERKEGNERQQRAHRQVQRAWADTRRGRLIRGMRCVFVRCLNNVTENRSAARTSAVGVKFARALGAAAGEHVSRESHGTKWSGLSRFVLR